MVSKTEIFKKGTDAHLSKYSIFSRQVYDSETEKYVTQVPKQWSTSPDFIGGQTYLSSDVIRKIDKNYQMYAVWPEVYVKFIYNYFDKQAEISKVLSGATVTLKTPTTRGFKGWLDKNGVLHDAGTDVVANDNTQMYVSACYDLSISYDLNGGYLEEGKHADTQAAQYSKWVGPDLIVRDIDAQVAVAADDPANKNGSIFSHWKLNDEKLHRENIATFDSDITAYAQWLFNHTYTFYELCSFSGTAPKEKYGQIDIVSESYDEDLSVRVYKATAEDGYLFDKWEVTTFDGSQVSPVQTLTVQQIEVALHKVQAAETRLDLYARSVAFFSYDNSWSLVCNAADEVLRRARITGTATNALLKTKNDTSVKKVLLGDGVTALEDQLFLGCSKLNVITMKNVTSIGSRSFQQTAFSEMTLPDPLQTIGDYAFNASPSLRAVTFNRSLKRIGLYAFSSTPLTRVAFGALDASIMIGEGAFDSCTSLSECSFPVNCTSVGPRVVKSATSLMEITFNQTSLGGYDDNALEGSSITTIYLKGISASDIMGT